MRTILCSLESHGHQHPSGRGEERSFKGLCPADHFPQPWTVHVSTHPAQGCSLPFRDILTLEDLHERTSSRTKREHGFRIHTLPANLSTNNLSLRWNTLLYYASFFFNIPFIPCSHSKLLIYRKCMTTENEGKNNTFWDFAFQYLTL